MKLALVADVHGNLLALDAVLADLAGRGVDGVVNVGDCVSGPLEPRETAERLMALGAPTIRGNHERQLVDDDPASLGASDRYAAECLTAEQTAWLRGLPATLSSGDVFVCHGTPGSDLTYFLHTVDVHGCRPATDAEVSARAAERPEALAASLIVCGHSHLPAVARIEGGPLVVNPGSVGLQAFTWDSPHPHAAATGSPHARYALVERRGAEWRVEHVAVPYDHEAAARAAESRGQGEWARALRTGRV